MAIEVNPAADFQALPLEFIVSAPLQAAVKAQGIAADTTRQYIESLINLETRKPLTVEFEFNKSEGGPMPAVTTTTTKVTAPVMSIVPIPHLRIDSMTIHFKYEISQIVMDKTGTEKGWDFSGGGGVGGNPWVNFTLKGGVSSKTTASSESTMNRSGTLEITVHASEAPMPAGLEKILTMMANSISAVKQ
ncbi:MAG: DUF2589 domain-containing protein [Deltaproteobacteria bacterium]|nr:DUF2589 domain-containing protein [Deltaproteobacteria bacterium]